MIDDNVISEESGTNTIYGHPTTTSVSINSQYVASFLIRGSKFDILISSFSSRKKLKKSQRMQKHLEGGGFKKN